MKEPQSLPEPSNQVGPASQEDGEDPSCVFCRNTIYDAYFEVNGRTTCQKCRYTVEEDHRQGSGLGRFCRASLAGGAAAAVGAGIYYAVLAMTEYEFALVSILVGLMVGFAVSWGSGYHGGWVYQTLAVSLTYLAIVSTYVPFLLEAWNEEIVAEAALLEEEGAETAAAGVLEAESVSLSASKAAMGVVAFALLVAAMPFLAGVENLLGLLIIGFGLFEAWRLNQFVPLSIEGPFRFEKIPVREGR